MSSTLRNLKWPDGQTNPSGIKSTIYYYRKADIKTFPTMATAPTTASEAVTYDGDFEVQAGKTAISIYSTQGVGKLEFEGTGEKDCRSFSNKGSFSYPDMNDEGIEFANANINSNGIFIAAHYVGGGKIVWVVLGSENFDSEVSIKGTSGAKIGEQKGLTIDVTAPDFYALPRYAGTITLADGTYNCATNVFTSKESAGS